MYDKSQVSMQRGDSHSNFASLVRICAILFVFLFHPLNGIDKLAPLSKLANLGPFLFLLVSGFLYGGKKTETFARFIGKRAVKVCIPPVLFSVAAIAVFLICGEEFSGIKLAVALLNLQGLRFISWDFFDRFFPQYYDLGYLWFVTIIMICYFLIPVLENLYPNHRRKHIAALAGIILVLSAADAYLNTYRGISLKYFVTFIIGYLCGNIRIDKCITKTSFYAVSAFTVLSLAMRIVLNRIYRGSAFYKIYAEANFILCAFFIFVICAFLDRFHPALTSAVSSSKAGSFLDRYSYFIYITHGIMCFQGWLDIFSIGLNPFVAYAVFIVLTSLLSVLLKILSDRVQEPLISALNRRTRCEQVRS